MQLSRSLQVIVASVLLNMSGIACIQPAVETNTPQPTHEPSSMPTTLPTPSQTPTRWPTPTASFTPTRRPSNTPTATPTPDKQILIQYGWIGSRGVGIDLKYMGVGMPEFVLYADGQLLIQEGYPSLGIGVTYSRAELSTDEMCNLLDTIKGTGFFELEDDGRNGAREPVLYTFYGSDEWPPGGSPNLTIQVNGDPTQDIVIIDAWLDYLIPEVGDVYSLLDSYHPAVLEPYVPDRILLLVTRERSLWWQEGGGGFTPQPWPDDLPPLAELDAQQFEQSYCGMRPVLLEGELASAVYRAQGSRISERSFSEDGEVYYLTARLLLPHETVDNLSPQPYVNRAEFPLPFDCEG